VLCLLRRMLEWWRTLLHWKKRECMPENNLRAGEGACGPDPSMCIVRH
jgi:hypothetical protein